MSTRARYTSLSNRRQRPRSPVLAMAVANVLSLLAASVCCSVLRVASKRLGSEDKMGKSAQVVEESEHEAEDAGGAWEGGTFPGIFPNHFRPPRPAAAQAEQHEKAEAGPADAACRHQSAAGLAYEPPKLVPTAARRVLH